MQFGHALAPRCDDSTSYTIIPDQQILGNIVQPSDLSPDLRKLPPMRNVWGRVYCKELSNRREYYRQLANQSPNSVTLLPRNYTLNCLLYNVYVPIRTSVVDRLFFSPENPPNDFSVVSSPVS